MENFLVQVLGSNSAMPAYGRKPSAHYISHENHHFLIDCGESTQFTMYDLGVKKSKISAVFITHLHGDHIFGLPGLLTSFELSGRTKPLTVYGPTPIKKYLEFNIHGVGHYMSYPLEIVELDDKNSQTIFSDDHMEVTSFPLEHRVPCIGYHFQEKKERRNIRKDIIEKYDLTVDQIKTLIGEEDVLLSDGTIVTPEKSLHDLHEMVSYAYCSDTKYTESILPFIENTTLLYHESTYLQELSEQARERYHSTAMEAASIAKQANVRSLLLGHFSSRYKDIEPFKKEANSIFPHVILAKEGLEINLREL